jgi:hypothetical protein
VHGDAIIMHNKLMLPAIVPRLKLTLAATQTTPP